MDNLFISQQQNQKEKRIFSVSDYIQILNEGLKGFESKIIGEVSEVNAGPTGHIYFTLKDDKDESILRCVIWRGNYNLYGIRLEEGMKIIVSGCPNLHSKYGFKFIVNVIELAGEGILKKEYERLKRQLEKEGLFSLERKKAIPDFPQKIGLITAEQGAAINDFLNNLGKYGYKIKFLDSRVEGQAAVKSLISAVEYFQETGGIDVLVIIRGGGSLESLQAFNNEILVRKIADCPFPVICGIGHDRDVPLVSLVADKAVSTPTAVTKVLNESWERGINEILFFEKEIVYKYQEMLRKTNYYLEELSNQLNRQFNTLFQKFEKLVGRFKSLLIEIGYSIKNLKRIVFESQNFLFENFIKWIKDSNDFLNVAEKQLKIFDPTRQLKFGYSIVYSGGKIIKSVRQVKRGEEVNIRVSDGKIKSGIKDIEGL